MAEEAWGKILSGSADEVARTYEKWRDQPIDHEMTEPDEAPASERQTTLGTSFAVTGPGTFLGRAQRTLVFEPTTVRGWRFDRMDLPGSMPISVWIENVWRTSRNVVLSSGSPHNYMRMVEHIVALKVGMGLDNVVIRMDSGDPPLFDRSSLDLVEGVESAGIVEQDAPLTYVTVKEPVTAAGANGSFLTFLPAENGSRALTVDCAIEFRSAIGKQRVRFTVNRHTFRYGAAARTNTTFGKMVYCRTIGKIFADTRNLGYSSHNILIAGPRRYYNSPGLLHDGKSLEAVWHRATLDLLAAVALFGRRRFAGSIISFKAGHTLDVQTVRQIYEQDLLTRMP
jgi:UDP-3-O-acyl-N-acetylglucosamine deacetylase